MQVFKTDVPVTAELSSDTAKTVTVYAFKGRLLQHASASAAAQMDKLGLKADCGV